MATAKSKSKTPPKKAKPVTKKAPPKPAAKPKTAKKPVPKTAKAAAGSAKKPAPKAATKVAKKPAPKVGAKSAAGAKAKAAPKAAKPDPKKKPAPVAVQKVAPKATGKAVAKPVAAPPAAPAKGGAKAQVKDAPAVKPANTPAHHGVAPVMAISHAHSVPRVAAPKPVAKADYVEKTPIVKFTPSTVREGGMLSEAEIMRQPKSDYMSKQQLAFFKHRLLSLQNQLRENAGATTEHLREIAIAPDPADRATLEEEHALELRTRDRERKLLKKVESALARIDDGSYGYCEETGEPIGIPRLIARPTATLTIEAQERRELKQRMYGE
ncbi:MAG: RNA polymerase-binding protein DksA [Betaproteobacteria bacterium]|nr:RNA polymerase-binding protein DksA [Betaproteobacteria bacterium]